MAKSDELSLRIAHKLFAQKARQELADFRRGAAMRKPGDGSDLDGLNGAGGRVRLEPGAPLRRLPGTQAEEVGARRHGRSAC